MKQNQDSKSNENLTIKQKRQEDSNIQPKSEDKKSNLENSIEKKVEKSESAININKGFINEIKVHQNQENKYKPKIRPYITSSNSTNSDCNCDCDCNCDWDKCGECVKNNIFTVITFVVEIVIIILIGKIYSMTEINPLETFMFENSNFIFNNYKRNLNQLNKKVFNNEPIYEETINKRKHLLRHLDTDCAKFNSKIEENDYQLNKTFDLGFKKVHKMALGLLIIYCIFSGLLILIVISSFGILYFEDCCGKCLASLIILMLFISIFASIPSLVLFIIMMVNYYKGLTTGDFLDYYKDCLDDDLKKPLESTYNKLHDLNKNFTAFVVLYFIEVFLNKISSCLKKKDD